MRHYVGHHYGVWRCPLCSGKVLAQKTCLKSHLQSAHSTQLDQASIKVVLREAHMQYTGKKCCHTTFLGTDFLLLVMKHQFYALYEGRQRTVVPCSTSAGPTAMEPVATSLTACPTESCIDAPVAPPDVEPLGELEDLQKVLKDLMEPGNAFSEYFPNFVSENYSLHGNVGGQ